ncbi:hypothetical protein [Aquibacillus rhizosphaerae]|uniref:Uncharacterized protein n=1 Tax=Aquibacillus rhizosphaerae TaxID=3051431 RepID=A0ABT7L1U9_9BACI|nr:hypothetical protein [Aquibacillus sp. LR5S19]MDL4839816.1 hypothetical protein [Aquibacillus sp. LR5S19]
MQLYYQSYLNVLKRNFMLVIMALILLIITFFIWAGFPFFIIGSGVAGLTTNLVIIHFTISISGGLLFSMYFVPINFKVAKNVAKIKVRGVVNSFVRIQIIWIIVSAIIFEMFFCIVLQL